MCFFFKPKKAYEMRISDWSSDVCSSDLMITYTGLVSLATHYMPWGIAANYADVGKFFEATAPWPVPGEKTGPAPLAPIGPIVEQAERRWGSAAGSVRILTPGDRSAQVIVSPALDAALSISLRSVTFTSAEK